MKATWHDIEVTLNNGTLEEQSRETLEAFSKVEPLPSRNPTYFERFRDAKERIRHRLQALREEEKAVAPRLSADDAGIWFVNVSRLLREIRRKAGDAQRARGKAALAAIKGYLDTDHDRLISAWPKNLECKALSDLGRHIHFFQKVDLRDILQFDVPEIEAAAERHLLANRNGAPECGFESLLHPAIRASAYSQFQSGHYRDAVLNSVIGLFDHVRKRSGVPEDGARLVNEVFGGNAPRLILSDITSDSGRNDQSGFHKMFLGVFEGVRNPKAHSLAHDLTPQKAAQYLVFGSLLARRVDEATPNSAHAVRT